MATTAGTVSTARLDRVSSPSRLKGRYLFYIGLPVLMFLAVIVGFAPTYYLKLAWGTPALPTLYHVHGALFTTWMLLLILQPALVAMGRTPLHRQIGVAGGVLAAVMTVMACAVGLDMGRRGSSPPGISPLMFMAIPLATVIVFPVLIGAALWWRRVPETHKRLMLIGTCELIPAGFGRWPVISAFGPPAYFGLTDLVVVALLVYDRATRGRFHPATLLGGAFLIASQVLRVVIAGTETWQSFARWLIS